MGEMSAVTSTRSPSERQPRVSVICPIYNAGPYLAEALDSVLSQDFRSFEVILVDDGSSDDSAHIAAAFGAKNADRIRIIQHDGGAHRGTSATRNLGLSAARGDLIAFIDADDRWCQYKLREQVALMDGMLDVDGLFGAVNYWSNWNGGRDLVYQTGHLRDARIAPPHALLRWYPIGKAAAPSMSDLMIRRSVVDRLGGFDDSFTGPYEEHTFLVKLYLNCTIYVSSKVWSDYRQHDRSCSAEMARVGSYDEVRERFLRWFETYLAETGNRNLHMSLAVQHAMKKPVSRRMRAVAKGLLRSLRLG
jgi:glycosyltransferase involved in cell wall biosynthesis